MRPQRKRIAPHPAALRIVAAASVAVIPVLLVAYAALGSGSYYLLSSVIVVLALVPFFAVFERRRPQAREIVPIAVMSGIAVAGRIAFAALPSFKPVTAIVMLTGAVFGPEAGFITGALSGLLSNFFFGQGPWTPWQMFAWGLIGLLTGLAQGAGLFRRRIFLYIAGALAGYLFGGITNLSYVFANGFNLTWQAVAATYASSFVFDTIHSASTVIFLLILANPLLEKLKRLKIKYGLLRKEES
ncbi:MAG: ECF transporter S component [Clostridia bacterium]|nr:ECF transporter S component [Clostridia bacterium]MDR3644407.1 ECF transporter S component [Clostridia bacterium]